MRAYLDLLRDALDKGAVKGDRTGTGVRSLFGRQLRFDLSEGFPLVTTKRLHLKSIVHELIWFLKGDTNIALSQGSTASASGTNGPMRRAISVRSTASNGAPGKAPTGGPTTRSTGSSHEIRRNPEFAAPHRLGLERGRHRADEARALPLPLPVLCRERAGFPASSTSARPTFSSACPSISRATRC